MLDPPGDGLPVLVSRLPPLRRRESASQQVVAFGGGRVTGLQCEQCDAERIGVGDVPLPEIVERLRDYRIPRRLAALQQREQDQRELTALPGLAVVSQFRREPLRTVAREDLLESAAPLRIASITRPLNTCPRLPTTSRNFQLSCTVKPARRI
ncbi:MAG: hypothetical protein ABIP94_08045 [Planctomycetota bacterium]